MSDVPLRDYIEKQLKLINEKADERDRRYDERFEAQETALAKAEQANMHWKQEAQDWRDRADERERNFMPKSMGAVLAALTIILLIIQLVRVVT